MINKVPNVRIAANKLSTFEALKAANFMDIPAFTANYEEAVQWVQDGKVVVNRTKLNGHSGAGIIMAARPEAVIIGCPLFVEYHKKKYEYRVHVAFGKVIDVQQKRKRSNYDGTVDYAVRNHHTGWVYCRNEVVPDERYNNMAIQAVGILGLDFGAVDIIYNAHYDKYYVLEVNTAPGLEGTTVTKYCEAFTERFAA